MSAQYSSHEYWSQPYDTIYACDPIGSYNIGRDIKSYFTSSNIERYLATHQCHPNYKNDNDST